MKEPKEEGRFSMAEAEGGLIGYLSSSGNVPSVNLSHAMPPLLLLTTTTDYYYYLLILLRTTLLLL